MSPARVTPIFGRAVGCGAPLVGPEEGAVWGELGDVGVGGLGGEIQRAGGGGVEIDRAGEAAGTVDVAGGVGRGIGDVGGEGCGGEGKLHG